MTNSLKNEEMLLLKQKQEKMKNSDIELTIRDMKVPFGTIMDLTRDAIVMLDELGNIVCLNLLTEQLFGYLHEEMIGKNFCSLVKSDEIFYEHHYNSFKTFQEIGQNGFIAKELELKVKHKNGREIDVNLSFSFLEMDNSWYAMGIIRDISDSKNTIIELENSRKRYEQLTENAPLGITSCDKEGNIVYVNQKTLDILGSASVDETKKINLKTFSNLVEAGFSGVLIDCLENNRTVSYDMNYKSKWDRQVWLRVHIKPLVERDAVIGAQIIIEDISEKRRFEEEKRKEQERLKGMLKGIPSPAWLISKEFRILAQNDVAIALFKKETGDYCWAQTASEETSFFYHHESLTRGESKNNEVKWEDTVWDTWWIPVGEDVYLYYATNITKYKKTEEKLLKLSVTDELTNAYNRRYFIQRLEEEIERANRVNSKFSLIMLDIDHFKEINDTLGHNVGDLVLKKCTEEVFQNRIRRIDKLARWGGEEFVILLPETTVTNAVTLAEDLRESLSDIKVEDVGKVTASFGVVEFSLGDTVNSIIQRSDQMMYKAKEGGRNCVRYRQE